jgi:hypothetical protein
MHDDIENTLEFQQMLNDMEDKLRARERQQILKFIKGKTLSEAKELVFVIKHEMPLNAFRKLH